MVNFWGGGTLEGDANSWRAGEGTLSPKFRAVNRYKTLKVAECAATFTLLPPPTFGDVILNSHLI